MASDDDDDDGWEDFDDSDGEEEMVDNVVVVSDDQMLWKGLRSVRCKRRRIRRAGKKRNVERFEGHFGCKPAILCQVFEDLQRTAVAEDRVPPDSARLEKFLMAMHAPKRCPTEVEREPMFDIDPQTGRDWAWHFLEKIQALKVERIRWPEDRFGTDVWVISVDGVHMWINEPGHPEWSQDSKHFSHKHGEAGAMHELGIALSVNRLVWMNGPHPAGHSDNNVFKKKGLKSLLRQEGKMAIGDGGYPGHPKEMSVPNAYDSKGVKRFKSRALKRHETFNNLIKNFDCLSGRFRHDLEKFKTCFEAVCVLCQYKLAFGQPLFDILIDGMEDYERDFDNV